MRSAVAALAVAALWAGASAQSAMMPKVVFSVALTGKARDAAQPDLNHVITSIASDGQSGQSSAADLCNQLQGLPLAAQFHLDEFFATCPQTFERAIATERASAMGLDPAFYTALSDLTVHLSQKQLAMDVLARAVSKNPGRLNFVQRLMQQHSAAGDVCQVGFGGGKLALLALQTMPNAKLWSFEGEESTVTVPAHDFLDAAHPDRLTLYLGDPAILVPRFITMHPETYCSAILIDGEIDDFALRDALVDMREVAQAGPKGHFVAITVPKDVLSATTLAASLKAAVNRGDFVIDAVTRGEMSASLADVQAMEDGEFFADALVVGHFTEFKME